MFGQSANFTISPLQHLWQQSIQLFVSSPSHELLAFTLVKVIWSINCCCCPKYMRYVSFFFRFFLLLLKPLRQSFFWWPPQTSGALRPDSHTLNKHSQGQMGFLKFYFPPETPPDSSNNTKHSKKSNIRCHWATIIKSSLDVLFYCCYIVTLGQQQ